MNKKSLFRLALTAVLMLVATATSFAYDFEAGGIYYTKNADGTTVTVASGSYSGDVVIPSSVQYDETTYSVTSIGNEAFYYSSITGITFPSTVTSVGYRAFYRCNNLSKVDVSSIEDWLKLSFTDYESHPLYYAKKLYVNGVIVSDLVIPNSVTSIPDWAFYRCESLTSVTIPNSVISIGEDAFGYCGNLQSVNIPNSVTSIGDYAFAGCSGLTGITIPNSVTSIGEGAFQYCSGFTSFTIPNSVKTIGTRALSDCSNLSTVIIGKSVTAIGYGAFLMYNSNLSKVILKAIVPPYSGGLLFYSNNYNYVVIVPAISLETYKTDSSWKDCRFGEPDSKITAIEFGASNFGVENGETLQLTAKVTPEDATFADVLQWTSSNPEVATVDDEGLVTTLALGTTVITATSCDGSNVSATCTVVVCPKADNVNELVDGNNIVGFAVQGVKMHDGVLYACTTAESVNKSTPTLHGNAPDNMDTYEDRNFAEFAQRDWVAISGLEGDFEGKELSYPFVAQFADGVLTPSETINATADATAYTLNTFRAENILHGGYSNYAEGDYKAYYVPARVNEVANFMGHIETVGEVKYLYSNNANGRKDGEGIKIEGNIANNSESYSLMEGILVADATTKAGVKIIMLKDLGAATGVEGVDTAAARIYTANGNIIIAATEDGEAAVYDFTGRLIKSVPVASGDSAAVPVTPGYYIVKTGTKTQSVVVK